MPVRLRCSDRLLERFICQKRNASGDDIKPMFDFTKLVYKTESSEWKALPNWARFYFELGKAVFELKKISQDEGGSERLNIAIATPTGAFGCGFITLGLVSKELENFGSRLADEAWEKVVLGLGPRTNVYVVYHGVEYEGVLGAIGEYRGEPEVNVLVKGGGESLTKVIVKKKYAARIRKRESGGLKKAPGIRRSREEREGREFFREFLKRHDVDRRELSHESFYLIRGLRDLRDELHGLELGLRSESGGADQDPISGAFHFLLRPEDFLPPNRLYLGRYYPTTFESTEGVEDEAHNVILCDGANALLRKSSGLKTSVLVSVLDRCEASFSRGVERLGYSYINRSSRALPAAAFENLPELPAGVEISAFWEGG